MKMKFLHYSLIVFSAVTLFACGGGNKIDTEKLLSEVDSVNTVNDVPQIDPKAVQDVLQSIPSPLETSFLIKETGSDYNLDNLNSTKNISKYSTSYDKALNLGIYGADLGYTNIFEKSQDGVFYLDAVTNLAEQLNIGQFFDYQTLKQLIKHNDNLDSLLMVTTSNFEKINTYLQEKNRSQLSVLLLYGGWIEGTNFLTQVYSKTKNAELREKIGEQKIVLEQLTKLLGYYEYDSNIKVLIEDLKLLEKDYSNVKIETTEGETSFQVVNGVMQAVSTSSTKVIVEDKTIQDITNTVNKIRKNITKN